ncbi:hypothetical protein E2C01_027327 [Portunus trituberculatus]|uniref:Uncharacterized protein n=1 Tax=Portunus trituberculatus TaxID=210409 RepID=A0A5B7EL18_PORTR|nr:hypothetical protein [Portunus trituberculatus]
MQVTVTSQAAWLIFAWYAGRQCATNRIIWEEKFVQLRYEFAEDKGGGGVVDKTSTHRFKSHHIPL